MKCETCKQETEKLYEENGLVFCSISCFGLYISVSKKWTEPLIPLREHIYPREKPTIH